MTVYTVIKIRLTVYIQFNDPNDDIVIINDHNDDIVIIIDNIVIINNHNQLQWKNHLKFLLDKRL